MALLNFKKRATETEVTVNPEVEAFLQDYSIEVMPRTAQKVEDLREHRHKLRGGSSGVTLRVRTPGGALQSLLRGNPSRPAGSL